MTELEQLKGAIAALDGQRAVLGDAVVDTALAPMREKLAALEAQQHAADQQLKYVTILFTDVTGSTQMGQRLDPEEIMAIMDGALRRFNAIVEQHEGRVLRFMGDGLKAAFGVPISREDDAERAVRAGLALLADAQVYAQAVERRWGISGFNIRVGINTGQVILGGGVEADNTAMGMTINLSARMESTAPPGGLRISYDTYRHVRGVFDVDEQPPLTVKGRDEPLRTYLVKRAKPRAFRVVTRGVEGIETRMVGRDAELRHLQETFETLLEDRALAIVTVVAEAGLGKSRLLYEFQNWLELQPQTFWLFQGRANPRMAGQPYGLLRDLLAWRFEILDSDGAEEARAKLVAGIAPLFSADGEERAQILGHLIGLDFSASPHLRGILADARQFRDRAFGYAAQFFRALSASDGSPIAILLDDIHWADDGSLDLINHLAQECRHVPLLIVCLTRPMLYERRPLWGSGQPFHVRFDLRPLTKRGSRELADVLLQPLGDAPPVLRELITGGGEGNPFYMEELLKMLIDDGVVVTAPDGWRVEAERLVAARVPPTLTGVLQARLDALPAQEKAALQQAAVVGHVFWDEAVAVLQEESLDTLGPLARRELIFGRETTTFDGAREYVFKHHVLHDVAYEGVLKRLRREYHRQVAAWLVGRSRERAGEYLGLIAEHYERAGDTANAAAYLRRAGEAAAARFANVEAVEYFSRALALVPPDDLAARSDLLLTRAKVYATQGARQAELQDIEALEALAERLDDDKRRVEVALCRARYANLTSDFRAVIAAAERAVRLAASSGAVEMEAEAYNLWGLGLYRQGEYLAAKGHLEHALALARRVGLRHAEAGILRELGNVVREVGLEPHLLRELGNLEKSESARAYYQESLRLHREIGDRLGEARTLNALGLDAYHRGDYVRARAVYQDALRLSREMGYRHGENAALGNLGLVAAALGDYAQARARYDELLRLAREIDDRWGQGMTLTYLALAEFYDQVDRRTVHERANAALCVAMELDNRPLEAIAQLTLGHTLGSLGRWREAAAAYERALMLRRGMGAQAESIEALAWLAHVALAEADLPAAKGHVEEIVTFLQTHVLDGEIAATQIYLTCYRALRAASDPRAAEILQAGYDFLQARAALIPDEAERRSFLENVSHNRALVDMWGSEKR